MQTVLLIMGGLGLFLYAISSLSEILKQLLGDNARRLLARYTRSLFSAILVGTLITLVLDSSSAVIILTIILINAGALNFRQSMGIVMGANIGTTFSSQLLALDITRFSPISIFIGIFLLVLSKQPRITSMGKLFIYFGILFFGLYTMETAVEPLRDNSQFNHWIRQLEKPWKGAAAGAIITVIIQSSSATVGMVITLAKKGLITLAAALSVMIGAELGTCADTLLATIRADRQAVKTGLFHFLFNLISIIGGLLLFPLFEQLVVRLSPADVEKQVANGHLLFNLLGVLIILPFTEIIARGFDRLLPDNQHKTSSQPAELSI